MANKKFRVLANTNIDGESYKPNDVVILNADTGKDFDSLDGTAAAVKYCIDELGSEPIDHEEVLIEKELSAEESEEKPVEGGDKKKSQLDSGNK